MRNFVWILILAIFAYFGYQLYLSHKSEFTVVSNQVKAPLQMDYTGTYVSSTATIDVAENSAISTRVTGNATLRGVDAGDYHIEGGASLSGNAATYTNGACTIVMVFDSGTMNTTANDSCGTTGEAFAGSYKAE